MAGKKKLTRLQKAKKRMTKMFWLALAAILIPLIIMGIGFLLPQIAFIRP